MGLSFAAHARYTHTACSYPLLRRHRPSPLSRPSISRVGGRGALTHQKIDDLSRVPNKEGVFVITLLPISGLRHCSTVAFESASTLRHAFSV